MPLVEVSSITGFNPLDLLAFLQMRALIVYVLFLAILAPGFSQTAVNPVPDLPTDPRAVLDRAAPFYDFSSPELKPWHLKATYQFYDLNGKPAEQGTWEYWWASPKVHRSTWTRAGTENTEWFTSDGAIYRKATGSRLRYFERDLGNMFFPPLPGHKLLDTGIMKLALRMLPPAKPELACVVVTFTPNPDITNDYCFEPATMALRIAFFNHIEKQYSQLLKTQGRYLARQVSVNYGKQTIFSVSVDTVEGVNAADAAFSPPADATLERPAIAPKVTGSAMGRLVKAGRLVKKTSPVYPEIANMHHVQGVVVLAAEIGTDGRVKDLEVLASPSPLLAGSAVNAVKEWEFEPFSLNGQPVEAETIVDVDFNLDR